MSNFSRLHPALQHQIVNSLGWRSLRPFQDEVIPALVEGRHSLILAPTAGGKTEAAFIPILSRMLFEEWEATSLLYLCPIKALLNNLESRLHRYCGLVGRRVAVLHGDVSASARRRIRADPPDCLLTTPESLEVLLDSRTNDASAIIGRIQSVIIDEIHSVAGDDRGWHLLSVLGRIDRVAGRELQRVGLSATVGNPEELIDLIVGSGHRPRSIFLPPKVPALDAEVRLDFVGSLENAAVVISRLHRGEKRLVFVDSRSQAETLASNLRLLDVPTFVTHSSLSVDQRRQAEMAFAERSDCVIVATSVLEMGIDVGDLDRVIQIDAPATVSSFLQRTGRTGRRQGSKRNCLMLATNDSSLLQGAALIELRQDGYVEPVVAPSLPYHVFAQQVMGSILQLGSLSRLEVGPRLEPCRGIAEIPQSDRDAILDHMVQESILFEDMGLLSFGPRGEQLYGRRNFLDLFSVFLSPPLVAVLHGRRDLGFVDEANFFTESSESKVLLLGGKSWVVKNFDRNRKRAYVEPSHEKGRSRWLGNSRGLGFDLCRKIQMLLAGESRNSCWSRRATERIAAVRIEHSWMTLGDSVLLPGLNGKHEWWTFGGFAANSALARSLEDELSTKVGFDSLCLSFDPKLVTRELEAAIRLIRERGAESFEPRIDARAGESIKFAECLPPGLVERMLARRLRDVEATRWILERPFVVRS